MTIKKRKVKRMGGGTANPWQEGVREEGGTETALQDSDRGGMPGGAKHNGELTICRFVDSPDRPAGHPNGRTPGRKAVVWTSDAGQARCGGGRGLQEAARKFVA